jgi:hypothetical protein
MESGPRFRAAPLLISWGTERANEIILVTPYFVPGNIGGH